MKLYFKHILRSIRRTPLQPLLSTIVIALAFFIAALAFNMSDYTRNENLLSDSAKYGSADIVITLNSNSQNRFMQPDDVYSVVGDEVFAAGCYGFAFSAFGSTVFGAAVDFEEIGGIFDIEFTTYGQVTQSSLHTSAFIASDFAQRYELSVGSLFTAKIFGYTKSYTVQGISPRDFLGNYEVVVDMSSIILLLAENYPFIAAMGEDFGLYDTLYIDVGDGDAGTAIESLQASTLFADKTITQITAGSYTQSYAQTIVSSVYVMVFFTIMTSAAVTLCCFYILSSRRSVQNNLFASCGANPSVLLLLQCSEILIYWLLGSLAGLALVCALANPLVELCGFTYVSAFGGNFAEGCAKALTVTLASAVLTAAGFYVTERTKGRRKKRQGATAGICALAAAAIAATICTFVTPIHMHYAFGFTACIAIILLTYFAAPRLFARAAAVLSKTRDATKSRTSVSFRYAVKNVRNVQVLHNTFRLTAILISLLTILALILRAGDISLQARETMFRADYLILNASSTTIENMEKRDGIESVTSFYWTSYTDSKTGTHAYVFSAEDYSLLTEQFMPESRPQGNEAVITTIFAKQYGYSIGDRLQLEINGQQLDLVITNVSDCPMEIIYFDCVQNGIGYNMSAVRGDGILSDGELEVLLYEVTALEMCTIISVEDYMTQNVGLVIIYILCGRLLFVCFVIFSAIGLADNLAESYRSRRKEFDLYSMCGMPPRGISSMICKEIAITLLCGAVAGVALAGILTLVVNEWLVSFGLDLMGLLTL